jgi:hypothetical protein
LIVFFLGTVAASLFIYINKSKLKDKTKAVATIALVVLVAGGLTVSQLLSAPKAAASPSTVAPLRVPTGYFSYAQPEFALALPKHVNAARFPSSKMYFLSTYDGDFNEDIQNPEDLGLIIVQVMQVEDRSDLGLDEFSRTSAGQITQLYASSSDPNFTQTIVDEGYSSILGRNTKNMRLDMQFSDSNTGAIKKVSLKMRMFADEETLRIYAICFTPNEETETVLSTLNIP